MLMHVSVCFSVGVCVFWYVCGSAVSLPPLPRWAYGSDHCGNHGRASTVTPGDERLHCHLWAARSIRQPGACLYTVGGGEMHSEQGVSVSTCVKLKSQL